MSLLQALDDAIHPRFSSRTPQGIHSDLSGVAIPDFPSSGIRREGSTVEAERGRSAGPFHRGDSSFRNSSVPQRPRRVATGCRAQRSLGTDGTRHPLGQVSSFTPIRRRPSSQASETPETSLIASGTGSGKTEAFVLPILARILKETDAWENSIRCC